MKVCIVTVYNSINSGSYWQAFSLGKYLKENGHEVYYYKRNNKGASASLCEKMKHIISLLIRFKFKAMVNYLKTIRDFTICNKNFNIIDEGEIDKIDLFILGSDTIWNLDTKYFTNNRKVYFGGAFQNKKKISYAASVANTKIETLNKYSEIKTYLNDIFKISVRDKHTKEVISNLINKEINIVCDPTLLLTKNEYEKLLTNNEEKNYIFLYLFKDLNEKHIIEVKKFAKENNLKIISGIKDCKWCDKSIVNAPQNFLNYMYNAQYVITDTFHGTIFAVNLNKNFIAINRNKNKVNEFLNKCNLNDRLISNQDIKQIFDKTIDYSFVNKILDEYRKESIEFLNNSLKD